MRERITLAMRERWIASRRELRDPIGGSDVWRFAVSTLCSPCVVAATVACSPAVTSFAVGTLCSVAVGVGTDGGTRVVVVGLSHTDAFQRSAGGPRVGVGGVGGTLSCGATASRIGAKGLKLRAIARRDSVAVAVAAVNITCSSAGKCCEFARLCRVLVRSETCASSNSAVLEPGILHVVGNHARLSDKRSFRVWEQWVLNVR